MTNYTHPSILKFKQLVELKDYRLPTKKEYVRYVWKLAEHFDCDPAKLSENQVRQYFLFLRQELQASASVMKGAKWALRCFYRESLKVTGWTVFEDLRVAEPKSLPTVLGREEVQRLLASVREPRFATCLRLMYYCGLRISEALRLEVQDILGREKPPRLHIRNAKGGNYAKVEVMQRWYSGDCGGAILSLYLAGGRGSRKPGEICEKTGCFRFRPATAPLQKCLGSSPHGGQPPWHNSQWLRVGFARARVHAWGDTPSRPGS